MIPEVYKPFIEKIIERTNEGEAKWHNSRHKVYVLRTKTSTVEVGHYFDEDAEIGNYFFNFRKVGQKEDVGFRVSHLEGDYIIMERLFAVAAASAANIKDELSSFLDELGQ